MEKKISVRFFLNFFFFTWSWIGCSNAIQSSLDASAVREGKTFFSPSLNPCTKTESYFSIIKFQNFQRNSRMLFCSLRKEFPSIPLPFLLSYEIHYCLKEKIIGWNEYMSPLVTYFLIRSLLAGVVIILCLKNHRIK